MLAVVWPCAAPGIALLALAASRGHNGAQSMPPTDDVLADLRLEVDTPEQVALEYPLAGLGSRFTALLVDLTIVGTLLVAAFVGVVLFLGMGGGRPLAGGWVTPGAVFAIGILWVFGLFWGYGVWFEAFRDGQTPGKRLLGVRVVMEAGQPVTLEAAAIRGLLRVVDLQGLGLLGGLVMLCTRRAQRLGDLAAGTVVVRELPVAFPEVDAPALAAGPPRLDDDAFAALERFVDRRTALPPDTRARLAAAVLPLVAPALEAPPEAHDVDAVLVRVHADETARRVQARVGSRAGTAAATALLRVKRARWEEFRALVARVRRRGLRRLPAQDVGDFAARYREIAADLARARTYGASAETRFALERLVGAGHNLLYRPGRTSVRGAAVWIARGFPALVRARWRPVALAAVLLFGPAIGSYLLLRARPDLEPHLLSPAMLARAEDAPSRRDAGSGYVDPPALGHAFFSTAIISNNVQVAFFAFALGIAAGLGTAAVLLVNGLHLGSVLAAYANRGALDVIGVFVLPHGVIELLAIAIAGGAGLWLGSGLVLPGRLTRRAALARRARDAIALVAGVAVLLTVAGLIEGFVSPAPIPDAAKLGVAAVAAAGLALYLVGGGREPAADDVTARRDA